MEVVIDIKDVTKCFGQSKILDGISFQIKQSECLGIVGPNGSGKTTLLNLIANLSKPTAGFIKKSLTISTKGIGYSMDVPGFFPDMHYQQLIRLLYAYKKKPVNKREMAQYVELFQVDKTFNKPFRRYSSGMKQKLSIISAFIGDPACIILDEPTNGLDVDAIFALKNHIATRNSTSPIILTSHSLSHLEAVCDRLIFLKAGEVAFEGSTDQIVQSYGNLETAYQQIIWSQNIKK